MIAVWRVPVEGLRATINPVIFRWDDYELDEAASELRRAGVRVEVQPKPFELLRVLLRERARTVSADELMQTLWPDVVVTPSSLTRAVSHARRAIGDTHKGQRIQSVARKGYRFVGAISTGSVAPAPARESGGAAHFATPFVGREDALAELRSGLAAAQRGAGSVAVVTGAAGIGKTRLLGAFASECAAAGVRCLEARCRDREGAPAYWVWVQLLRELAEGRETPALRELQRRTQELDLAGAAGDARAQSPEQSRFLFFEAVSDVLREAAREAPLVLAIEDAQWAAAESLRLLEHVAYEIARLRMLVVATVRDDARARRRPIDRTLVVLRQLEHCRPIELRALSRREVGELLARLLGRAAPPDLISELASRTEGVPLFLREALRSLHASGDLKDPERLAARALPIAAQSLQLLRRSLDALPERCLALLEAGAVLGREFSLPVAADVAGIAREEAAEALDAAGHAGVVEAAGAPATWRFSHALHREAIYDGIAPGRRARLHLRAAERIEQRAAGEASGVASELSHHHFEALAVGDAERAIRFAEAAAEQATARLSWEDAALHLRRAATALDHLPTGDPPRKLEALLRLGEAWALAREPENRRATLLEASALASSLERTPDLVRAAVLYCDLSEWSPRDEDAEPLLRAALARVSESDARARAQLLTRLAYRHIRRDGREARKLAGQALPLARATEDPQIVQEAAYILLFALAGPDYLEERAALREEIERAALATPRRDTGLIALLDLACDRLMLGDPAGARELRRAAEALAGASPHPGLRWHLATYDAGLAGLEGRFAASERIAQEAFAAGQRARHPFAQGCLNIQRASAAIERGDWSVTLEHFGPLAERHNPGWGVPIHWTIAFVARAQLASGDEPSARALWRRLAEPGFAAMPRNIRWTRSVAEVAHLCADLGEERSAAELIALIEPVSEQHAVLPIPVGYGGPLRHALARLYDLSGKRSRAEEAFAQALADAERVGAEGWRQRILLDAARAARDAKRARSLLEEAASAAERLGQTAVARAARAELERAPARRSAARS